MTAKPYIEPQAFLAEAQSLAGADDWGGDGFEEAFHQFVSALNAEAKLTPLGVERTRSHVRKLLVSRLRLFQDRKLYPGIAREELRAPFLIMGLARSGTSFLHALLAADPRNCSASHWQAWTLSPPPGLAGVDNRPNMAAGERFIRFEGWDDPEIRTRHLYTSANAVEDPFLQEPSFRVGSLAYFWNVPSYGAWFRSADLSPAYRIQRMVMQALQHGAGRDQWALKGPLHLGQLAYVFEAFPDARLVMNHRDPAKAFASALSLHQAHRRQFGDAPLEVDAAAYIRQRTERVAASLRTLIELRRDPAVDRRFVDVAYLDLEADPLGQVEKVYGRFGVALPEDARAPLERYVAENRKGKYGGHKYDIADTGVRAEEVREKLKFYTDHYGVPLEI